MSTKDRIIEEAARMFLTYGIRAVTMDMLASQMGISKRTIYELFRDKDELLMGVIGWMSVKQSELVKHSLETSGNVIEAVFKIMDRMMDHYRKLSPAFKLDIKRLHNDIARNVNAETDFPDDSSKQILVQGIKEGVFRNDIDIDITHRCLKGMTRMNEKEPTGDFESEDVVRDFFVNYLRGISTQKGLDLINIYDNRKNMPGQNRNLWT